MSGCGYNYFKGVNMSKQLIIRCLHCNNKFDVDKSITATDTKCPECDNLVYKTGAYEIMEESDSDQLILDSDEITPSGLSDTY